MKAEDLIELLPDEHAKLGRNVATEIHVVVVNQKTGKQTTHKAKLVRVNYQTYAIEIVAHEPTPAIKCEHEWEDSPTADIPTRTKCRLCQQTCPY